MNLTPRLVDAAERLFDRHGYMATGMDQLTRAAGMSSRTLYKHAGSKAQLMAAVLAERDRRFLRQIEVSSVEALFAALAGWIRDEGARGCLFLRSRAETGGDIPEIADAVAAHKDALRQRVAGIVAADLGAAPDPLLVDQVLVLVEGATHAAVTLGPEAVEAARSAAAVLVAQARA